MADFTSGFWNWFIVILTVISFVAIFILIRWMSTGAGPEGQSTETMGHVWDEDLKELNNPLPRWWLNLFYITLFFGIGYLALYPGLGTFEGWLGWSSAGQYEKEVAAMDARVGPLYEMYTAQDVTQLASNPKAYKMGERLFVNYCATCHGSDARGARGFPNLRDHDWLWGGTPETIKQTITNGRTGIMPAWKAALGGDAGVSDVTDYVLSLSGRTHDAQAAERGKPKFQQFCFACHGADGKGNMAVGAPNLTDAIWLHGGSRKRIMEIIAEGRQNHMPPHGEFLGDSKIHLLTAYIYGISFHGSK